MKELPKQLSASLGLLNPGTVSDSDLKEIGLPRLEITGRVFAPPEQYDRCLNTPGSSAVKAALGETRLGSAADAGGIPLHFGP